MVTVTCLRCHSKRGSKSPESSPSELSLECRLMRCKLTWLMRLDQLGTRGAVEPPISIEEVWVSELAPEKLVPP